MGPAAAAGTGVRWRPAQEIQDFKAFNSVSPNFTYSFDIFIMSISASLNVVYCYESELDCFSLDLNTACDRFYYNCWSTSPACRGLKFNEGLPGWRGKQWGRSEFFFYWIVILQSSSVGDRWLFGGDLHLKLYPMKLYCNTGNKNIPTVFDNIFDIRTHSWFIKQGAKVIICVYILVTLLFFFNTQHSKRNSIVCFYSFKTLLSQKPIYTFYCS